MASQSGKDLFDDREEDEVEEQDSSFRVNKRYAKEYTSRKQREELLHARQQGHGDDSSSSISESEDEDGDLLSPSVDINILKVCQS